MEKPSYEDYFGDDGSGDMKKFIIDNVRWLQEQGNEKALEVPITALEKILPDGMKLSSDPSDYEASTQMVLMKLIKSDFAGDIFDPMLQRIGSSMEDIKAVQENGYRRRIPGLPVLPEKKNKLSNEEIEEAMFDALKREVYGNMAPVLVRAAALGKPDLLIEKLSEMEKGMTEALAAVPDASEDAQNSVQELIDYTRIYTELIDDSKIDETQYNGFMNLLTGKFIENRVDAINNALAGDDHSHDDHSADECNIEIAKDFGAKVMHVLWRRYYGDGPEPGKYPQLERLTDISVVLFDAFNNTIEFTGLTPHPALEQPIMENLHEHVPENNELREEVFSIFTEFARNNHDVIDALKRYHEEDNAARIMVTMTAACPQVKVLDECMLEIKSSSTVVGDDDLDAALQQLLNGG